MINVYVPNSGRGDSRGKIGFLPERLDWEDELRLVISKKQLQKPVIYCGDMNVVHAKIDIYNWDGNLKMPGMSEEERGALLKLKDKCGLIDAFRELHPKSIRYSWFSNFGNARVNG